MTIPPSTAPEIRRCDPAHTRCSTLSACRPSSCPAAGEPLPHRRTAPSLAPAATCPAGPMPTDQMGAWWPASSVWDLVAGSYTWTMPASPAAATRDPDGLVAHVRSGWPSPGNTSGSPPPSRSQARQAPSSPAVTATAPPATSERPDTWAPWVPTGTASASGEGRRINVPSSPAASTTRSPCWAIWTVTPGCRTIGPCSVPVEVAQRRKVPSVEAVSKAVAVGGEVAALHQLAVAGGLRRPRRRCIPQARRPITADGDEQGAVGAEPAARHRPLMAPQGGQRGQPR